MHDLFKRAAQTLIHLVETEYRSHQAKRKAQEIVESLRGEAQRATYYPSLENLDGTNMPPEALFKRRINDKLDVLGVFHESAFSPYSTGRPDQFYEGDQGDLFIEYKWYPLKRPMATIETNIDRFLSPRQTHWINRRRRNHKAAWVAVGLGNKRVLLDATNILLDNRIRPYNICSEDDLASLIFDVTGKTK